MPDIAPAIHSPLPTAGHFNAAPIPSSEATSSVQHGGLSPSLHGTAARRPAKQTARNVKDVPIRCEVCSIAVLQSNMKRHRNTKRHCDAISAKEGLAPSPVGVTCDGCNKTISRSDSLRRHYPSCTEYTDYLFKLVLAFLPIFTPDGNVATENFLWSPAFAPAGYMQIARIPGLADIQAAGPERVANFLAYYASPASDLNLNPISWVKGETRREDLPFMIAGLRVIACISGCSDSPSIPAFAEAIVKELAKVSKASRDDIISNATMIYLYAEMHWHGVGLPLESPLGPP